MCVSSCHDSKEFAICMNEIHFDVFLLALGNYLSVKCHFNDIWACGIISTLYIMCTLTQLNETNKHFFYFFQSIFEQK